MIKDYFRIGLILGIMICFIGISILPVTGTIKIIEKNETTINMTSNKIITVDANGQTALTDDLVIPAAG